ncbi:hypothetical protein ACFS7Z_00170 [Pontibacter toksunensis]|uniref:Penicillin amidase n=1 Tax=Pontibacter toksunensis TaxID=1332631 RepID=A0ABW6BNS0_9BACT
MKTKVLKWAFAIVISIISINPNYGCTIFVLTDSKTTLFFYNEDFSNPTTRIWFLPGGKEYYGVAYVGFDNDWAQGGLNTAGLAFDWVAGPQEQYVPDKKLLKARGNNPSERMLESCTTVEEAIAFYRKYQEPSFSNAKIMIADKTGASVIIGARDGQLHFDRSSQSRGLGYGEKVLAPLLAKTPKPSLSSGLSILQSCAQKGQYATKYSSVNDLRSGDIFLTSPGHTQAEIKLNLISELEKGGHYFDMPNLPDQLNKEPLVLRQGMKRFIYDGYPPITDSDPAIDLRFRTLFENSATGNLKEEEFTPELWKQIEPTQKDIQKEFKRLGKIQVFKLLERKEVNKEKSFLYIIEYETATVLQRFVLNDQNQLSVVKSEYWEQKVQ